MREKILNLLENNGRIDIHDMSVMLGVAQEEVANEIADMEKEHIICGYNTLINWDKTGDEKVTALIEVKVTPQRGLGFDSIAETIYKYDEVTSVYLMSGGFDFTVIIEGKTMKSVAQFVAAKLAPLDSVLSTSTHFVLKKYKDYGTVIDEKVTSSPNQPGAVKESASSSVWNSTSTSIRGARSPSKISSSAVRPEESGITYRFFLIRRPSILPRR